MLTKRFETDAKTCTGKWRDTALRQWRVDTPIAEKWQRARDFQIPMAPRMLPVPTRQAGSTRSGTAGTSPLSVAWALAVVPRVRFYRRSRFLTDDGMALRSANRSAHPLPCFGIGLSKGEWLGLPKPGTVSPPYETSESPGYGREWEGLAWQIP